MQPLDVTPQRITFLRNLPERRQQILVIALGIVD
jgi:hypothetical protein